MDQVDVSKLLGEKVSGVIQRVMDELVPEVRPLMEQAPDLQKLPPGPDRDGAATLASGTAVAILVVSSMLAHLRGVGCPEDILEHVVTTARKQERLNAKVVSS